MRIDTDSDMEYLLEKAKSDSDGMFMHEAVKNKIGETLESVDILMKEINRYFWASAIFFTVSIACIFLGFMVIQIASLIGALIMWHFQSKIDRQIVRKMGFVDGLFCGTIELDKDFSKFRKEMDSSGVGDKLREIVKNAKVD